MYTIGVILSAMPFPKCKPSLDMFINPSLEVMTSILAIEVNLFFVFQYFNYLFKCLIIYIGKHRIY